MSAPVNDNNQDAFILVMMVGKTSLDALPEGIKMTEGKISVPWTGSYRAEDGILYCKYDNQEFRFYLADIEEIRDQHGSLVWTNSEQTA